MDGHYICILNNGGWLDVHKENLKYGILSVELIEEYQKRKYKKEMRGVNETWGKLWRYEGKESAK